MGHQSGQDRIWRLFWKKCALIGGIVKDFELPGQVSLRKSAHPAAMAVDLIRMIPIC